MARPGGRRDRPPGRRPVTSPASLRRLFGVEGVTGTRTIVVPETFFERPLDPRPPTAVP
ncbi:hypothetical protein KBX37_18335 [Micromonospora sp. U56]|uniref:hypothetical protein n=1 Tax=Micromonospora sp. U56 TaxID=2824900 RepID=UPI001B371416|nr:hypothetical protein [Micromonospora sp. U56]MBQ0895036.1 hypothetical protein [Micromonospora sp. U56]